MAVRQWRWLLEQLLHTLTTVVTITVMALVTEMVTVMVGRWCNCDNSGANAGDGNADAMQASGNDDARGDGGRGNAAVNASAECVELPPSPQRPGNE